MVGHEDIAGRALDALSPDETRRFDEQADAQTQEEVAEMRETAAMLSKGWSVAPPAAMRASVLAQIAQTPQERSAPALRAMPVAAEEAAPASIDRSPALAGGARERAAQRRWFTRPGSLLAAAAAAAVLLVGGIAIGQTTSAPDPMAQLVHASDVETASGEVQDGTTATMLWSEEQGSVAIMLDGLEGLSDEQVYEAWFLRGDDAVPAGIFDAADGTTVHLFDGEMQEGDRFGVTVEPAGGSTEPTTTPILVMTS